MFGLSVELMASFGLFCMVFPFWVIITSPQKQRESTFGFFIGVVFLTFGSRFLANVVVQFLEKM